MKHGEFVDGERALPADVAFTEAEARWQAFLARRFSCICNSAIIARRYLGYGYCVLCGCLREPGT